MFKRKTQLLIITSMLAGLLAVLTLAGCSSAATASGTQGAPPPVSQPREPSSGQIQSSSGGSVTIAAELLGHQNDSLVFEISMQTHSVNLDQYDLKQLALLRDDKGGEYSPVGWDSAPGGHHRRGKLVFAHADQSAKSFELVIRDVAGVGERVLRWQAN